MKKTITSLMIITILMNSAPYAFAGDKDWAVAGKILTGIIGVGLISEAIHNSDSHHTYVVKEYHGRPVHHKRRCVRKKRKWVPGHYEYTEEKVWVPCQRVKTWIEPVYESQYIRGCYRDVKVRDGYYLYETIQGHYENREVKKWVKGYYIYVY